MHKCAKQFMHIISVINAVPCLTFKPPGPSVVPAANERPMAGLQVCTLSRITVIYIFIPFIIVLITNQAPYVLCT